MECSRLSLLSVSTGGLEKYKETPCLGPSSDMVWYAHVIGVWTLYGWPSHPKLQWACSKLIRCKDYQRIRIFIQDSYKNNTTTWFATLEAIWKQVSVGPYLAMMPHNVEKKQSWILGSCPNYWDRNLSQPSTALSFAWPPRPQSYFALRTKPFIPNTPMEIFQKVPEQYWAKYLTTEQISTFKAQTGYLDARARLLRDCYYANYKPEPAKVKIPSVRTPKGLAHWPGKKWSEIDLPTPQAPIKDEEMEPGSIKSYLTVTISSDDIQQIMHLKIEK